MRLGWDEYFLEIAKAVSLRADCIRSKVGAVLVSKDNRILSVGYNGSPSGDPGCLTDNACPRGQLSYDELPSNNNYENCIAIHAEVNAVTYARFHVDNSTLYITRSPCADCQLMAMYYGIKRIVWTTPDNVIADMKLYD